MNMYKRSILLGVQKSIGIVTFLIENGYSFTVDCFVSGVVVATTVKAWEDLKSNGIEI